MRPQRACLLILSILLAACSSSPVTASAPSQSLVNKGSDTMVNLALAWAEAYGQVRPEVSVAVTGGGSGTGIAALINNTVDIANASRAIKPEEVAEAEAHGITPVEFVVARDAIAVIVHRSNPVNQLTMEQISRIYSGEIENWSEVGGEDRPIVRLSRETNSGTHVYFLEEVLRLGQKDNPTLFSSDTLLLPSSEGITAELSYDQNAIGYDGLGYVTDAVKVIAVAREAGGPFVLPSADTVNNGSYPIARDLYMYTSGQPSPPSRAYLDWILGPDGQAIVTQLGFVPVSS
ncbi:MAG TPA: phosphate ABC transporter substrate-binding protein [Anaerolineales bacterium]|nr:phosphate ABC transporter substrate-binding protein [Anaerolineales bacterium]